MAKIRKLEYHGRETYAVHYGDDFVVKRPLPTFGEEAQQKWLEKQHRTQGVIDEIRSVGNSAYNIPKMFHINDEEVQIIEERAPGVHFTKDLYRTLSRRQKVEIHYGLASFLADMNELKPVEELKTHKISTELKFSRLENFVESKMSNWFNKNDVRYMVKLKDSIASFEYETRKAWAHGDLNTGNVLYDVKSSKLSFIDFAEADYDFIYKDIFAPLQIELGICKNIYALYYELHNKSMFPMLSPRNQVLQDVMKHRIMVVYLKRFIKAADDLRLNPKNQKSVNNNAEKIAFIKDLIQNFQNLERLLSK